MFFIFLLLYIHLFKSFAVNTASPPIVSIGQTFYFYWLNFRRFDCCCSHDVNRYLQYALKAWTVWLFSLWENYWKSFATFFQKFYQKGCFFTWEPRLPHPYAHWFYLIYSLFLPIRRFVCLALFYLFLVSCYVFIVSDLYSSIMYVILLILTYEIINT